MRSHEELLLRDEGKGKELTKTEKSTGSGANQIKHGMMENKHVSSEILGKTQKR